MKNRYALALLAGALCASGAVYIFSDNTSVDNDQEDAYGAFVMSLSQEGKLLAKCNCRPREKTKKENKTNKQEQA